MGVDGSIPGSCIKYKSETMPAHHRVTLPAVQQRYVCQRLNYAQTHVQSQNANLLCICCVIDGTISARPLHRPRLKCGKVSRWQLGFERDLNQPTQICKCIGTFCCGAIARAFGYNQSTGIWFAFRRRPEADPQNWFVRRYMLGGMHVCAFNVQPAVLCWQVLLVPTDRLSFNAVTHIVPNPFRILNYCLLRSVSNSSA